MRSIPDCCSEASAQWHKQAALMFLVLIFSENQYIYTTTATSGNKGKMKESNPGERGTDILGISQKV